MVVMSTKSREVKWGGQIMGTEIHARHARQEAQKAAREADRAEACAGSIQMEGYGGPAQSSPTIGQCILGGAPFPEPGSKVMCPYRSLDRCLHTNDRFAPLAAGRAENTRPRASARITLSEVTSPYVCTWDLRCGRPY